MQKKQPRPFLAGLMRRPICYEKHVRTELVIGIESGVIEITVFDPAHTVKNAAEVRSVLEKSGQVLAVFAGHYHDGGYQQVNGIDYVALQANTAYGNDASYHNQYATIDVRADGKKHQLTIAGNGLQKSYVINKILP